MDDQTYKNNQLELEHLKFIKERLRTTDFRAEEKLKQLGELAEIIFAAKENYKKQKDS